MHRAQIQLCDLPTAPLVSSHGIAAKHYISLPQTGKKHDLGFLASCRDTGKFLSKQSKSVSVSTNFPAWKHSSSYTSIPCPVGVRIFPSVCTDSVFMDQDVHIQRGGTAWSSPGGLLSPLPALLHAHSRDTQPGCQEAAQKDAVKEVKSEAPPVTRKGWEWLQESLFILLLFFPCSCLPSSR